MKKFLLSKKQALTFAETMITMLIIGFVAALILPTLLGGFTKNIFQASFADAYKNFNKSLYNYSVNFAGTYTVREEQEDGTFKETEHKTVTSLGNSRLSSTHLFEGHASDVAEKLAKQFNTTSQSNGCWGGKEIFNNFDNTGNATTRLDTLPCFKAGNGFIYAFELLSENCSTDMRANNNQKHKLSNSCAIVYIDINGTDTPNVFGQDVYAFIITDFPNSALYPVGGSMMKAIPGSSLLSGVSTWENSCDETHKDGRTCAGRIVEEGMRIRYLK